jgi:hypothetical protein
MSNQIPGVPEGWELVAFRRAKIGEHVIDGNGNPCKITSITSEIFAIIRKIEKPAKYRPFANAEEYLPHWGKPIRLKDGTGFDSVVSTGEIGVYIAASSTIIHHSMPDAFDLFEFADGTPFGVKIDE